jgi:hypothetical protein
MYKLVKYKLDETTWGDVIGILKDSNTFIPLATDNRDYQEYLEWLAQGNEPEPADGEEV